MKPVGIVQMNYAQAVKEGNDKTGHEITPARNELPAREGPCFQRSGRNVKAVEFSEADFTRSVYVAGNFTHLSRALSQRKWLGVSLDNRSVIGIDMYGQFIPLDRRNVNKQQQANMELATGAFCSRVKEWGKVLHSKQSGDDVRISSIGSGATVEYLSKQFLPFVDQCGFIHLYQNEKRWIEALKVPGSSPELFVAQDITALVLDEFFFQEGCELKDYLSDFYSHLQCVFKDNLSCLKNIEKAWSEWYQFDCRQQRHIDEVKVPEELEVGVVFEESDRFRHDHVASRASDKSSACSEPATALHDHFSQISVAASEGIRRQAASCDTGLAYPQRNYRQQARQGKQAEIPRVSKYSKRHIFDMSVVLQEVKNRNIHNPSHIVLLKANGKVAFARNLEDAGDNQKARNFLQSLYTFELRREEMVRWFAPKAPYFVRMRRNDAFKDINSARVDQCVWILEQAEKHSLSEIHRAEGVLVNNLLREVHKPEEARYDAETLTDRVFNYITNEELHIQGRANIQEYYQDIIEWCRHNISTGSRDIETVRSVFNTSLRLLHAVGGVQENREVF